MASIKDIISKTLSTKKNDDNKPVETAFMRPQKQRRPRPEHTDFEKWLVIVINGNALAQFFADIVLEILHLIPTRVNHLSLTLLNAFIAFKTLSAVHKGKFQFLHEDCQILWLMELCLIVGDVFHMLYYPFEPMFIYVRAAFIFCSLFNLLSITFIMWKYKLFSITYQGHKEKRRSSLSRVAVKAIVSIWKESSKKVGVEENSSKKSSLDIDGSKYLPAENGGALDSAAPAADLETGGGRPLAPSASTSERKDGATGSIMIGNGEADFGAVEGRSNRGDGHPIFGDDFGAQSDSESDQEGDAQHNHREDPINRADCGGSCSQGGPHVKMKSGCMVAESDTTSVKGAGVGTSGSPSSVKWFTAPSASEKAGSGRVVNGVADATHAGKDAAFPCELENV